MKMSDLIPGCTMVLIGTTVVSQALHKLTRVLWCFQAPGWAFLKCDYVSAYVLSLHLSLGRMLVNIQQHQAWPLMLKNKWHPQLIQCMFLYFF